MNSIDGLTKAMLNQHIDPRFRARHRPIGLSLAPATEFMKAYSLDLTTTYPPYPVGARWNVFSLLSATGWSGSAFAGGALADRIGYRGTFCVTLGFHTASILCLLPLVWLVPRAAARRSARGDTTLSSSLRQPLASADAEALRTAEVTSGTRMVINQ